MSESDVSTLPDSAFRLLVEGAPDGICVHRDGRVRFVNPALVKMLGFDGSTDLIGTSVIDRVHPDDRAIVLARIQALGDGEGSVPFTDERLIRRDGSIFVASIGGLRVSFEGAPSVVAIVRDVTERKRLDRQTAQAERMASIGALSAGVAHEINNPLTYVLLRIDVMWSMIAEADRTLRDESKDPAARVAHARATFSDLRAHLSTAKEGAQRVRRIVRDLRVFARADGERPTPVEIRGPIELALGMISHELASRAEVTRDLESDLFVMGSEGSLAQVFLHLLMNAIQAIPDGGRDLHAVTVTARGDEKQVVVRVEDTGSGIATEHLPRIFEPFFTTKPPGLGTGLGLSTCHGIVTHMGGTIQVDTCTEPPRTGTIVTVTLPAAIPIARSSVPPPSAPHHDWPPTHRERVLVAADANDERERIRKGVAHLAEIVCAGPETALEVLANGAPFEVLVLVVSDPKTAEQDTDAFRRAVDDRAVGTRVIPIANGADVDDLVREIAAVLHRTT